MDLSNYITPDWPAPANVQACISTRKGGFSSASYESKNLGLHVGDNAKTVGQNRIVLCEDLGLLKSPQWLEQIHGNKVVVAKSDGLVRTADGSCSSEIGQPCLVMTADCLPILLCDISSAGQAAQVAAIHCGWRSLSKGIVARALDKFASPKNILAYLGPAISQPHFEVGVDVLEAFFKSARSPAHADEIANAFKSGKRPLHFYADIYALARAELRSLGVTKTYGGDYCTYADVGNFFSYRRDGITGRMASLVWLSK